MFKVFTVSSGDRNVYLGAVGQAVWGTKSPLGSRKNPDRRSGGLRSQKLEQFSDIAYRF